LLRNRLENLNTARQSAGRKKKEEREREGGERGGRGRFAREGGEAANKIFRADKSPFVRKRVTLERERKIERLDFRKVEEDREMEYLI